MPRPFSNKRDKHSVEKWLILGRGQGVCRSLQRLVVPESKEVVKHTDENVSKDTQVTLKEILICPIWDNMNIKINKDNDESEPPQYRKNL